MLRRPRPLFRTLAFAEAVSWTLLLGGLVLRATLGWDLAVTIGGAVHGFVFLSYGATVVLVMLNNRWRPGPSVAALAAAIVPYATIPVEMWVQRRGLLEGEWRIAPDPAAPDRRWYDRPLAWLLRRPWLLFGALAVALVALYVVLLLVGPPGGRG
ncbi:DUF3817 domain-containing protein [Microbacterium sp. W1N]|uniref:DUF3817 domain-containing protein n=1 Tax=Microbacterium festucae TaxID=2977531 RepID=UPI0021C08648|nr:DUF3817 domain-containing protein [Microbacterium festucae]MCT9820655.1 DUF3817 domain-containing protein [Microbacterium festucae]